MWKNSILYLICLLSYSFSFSQFGNEWIDEAQSYYKFKIGKDDFYRIDGEHLQAAGFPISSVPASRVQLFREGVEVALNVNTNSDGTLNYLEFYGKKKDGTSDRPLYAEGNQPHSYYSLYTDSASYFLTYKLGNSNGKRMAFSSDKDPTGLTPESYHLEDTIRIFTSNYAPGVKFGSGASFSLSTYDAGETWTGSFQGKNNSRDFTFLLSDRRTDRNTTFETVLIGGNSLQHNVNISAGENTASLTSITNVNFNGWGSQFYQGEILNPSIGSNGELNIRVLAEGFPGASERISVSYIRVEYPQEISLKENGNKVVTLDNQVVRKAWLQFPTSNASSVRIFNITDPSNTIRMATTVFSDRIEVVVPDVRTGYQLMAVTNPASVGRIESVEMPTYNLLDKDYLIITHSDLRDGDDPVNDYRMYRESAAGGNYSVQVANVSDLFNLFGYGDPTPLALRNFIRFANSRNPTRSIFIIGKGLTPNYNYYRSNQDALNIPTYGLPGSDLMYTLGINSDPAVPGIPIGRLNAFTSQDVTSYLDKIKVMESKPFDELWRKDFLQLSGGTTQAELNAFANYIQDFTQVLEKDFIGGRAFNTGKQTSEAVEFVDVTDQVNKGVGYITFFGHSGGNSTDIEIGRVSEVEFGFANQDRYPMFLVNGCKAGDIFGTNFTFGEDWMITPNLGAIGLIAHSDVASAGTLKRWTDLYYKIGFGNSDYINGTVGDLMTKVSADYLSLYGESSQNLTQIQQMLLQGDPAYLVFGATQPDYFTEDNSLSFEAVQGNEILASQDSFKVNVIIKNFGRTIVDSLEIQVDRVLPDGNLRSLTNRYPSILRNDTISFYLTNDGLENNVGSNSITVRLDPQNRIVELDEVNNSASKQLTIFSGNTFNLFPIDNGVLSSSSVLFQWQASDLLNEVRSYDLEFDAKSSFDSPLRRSFSVSGSGLLQQEADLSALNLPDSATIFWRTRFSTPSAEESNEWVSSSFTLINGNTGGWGQFSSSQVLSNELVGIEYDQGAMSWKFKETTRPIEIFTFGVDNQGFSYEDIDAIVDGVNFMVTSTDEICQSNTLNAIVFDKSSGDPYRPIVTETPDVNNREVCGRLPQRIYQFREQDLIGDTRRLDVLLSNMRDGDQIVMFNIGIVSFSSWDPSVESSLNSIGVSSATIASLTDGQPVIFFGRKGAAPGSATVVINNGSAVPVTEQGIRLQDNALGSATSGRIRSRRIGPAKKWENFSYNLTDELNDAFALELVGIATDGTSSPLFSRARSETVDVGSIDPVIYPEIELVFSFNDETDQTPPQLNFWEVNYAHPPEGMLFPEGKKLLKLQEGAQISREFNFFNLSSVDFSDSLNVMTRLINQANGTVDEKSFKIAPPLAGDTSVFEAEFSSFDMAGLNSVSVEVLASENEVYDVNNRITLTNLIEVQEDRTNPVLDVTFDGYHILDGDIVSPNTTISIRMRDDNPFAKKTDTLGFNISLKLPGDGAQFQRVNFSDPRLTYSPASENQDFEIDFQPGPLTDGLHAIQVRAEDEAGNESGSEPYEISFEVVTESTITHFYPYPNPFSTNCRFVFTLTGSEVPDEIKIQILTVSGRVVREITQDEIGPIRVGNNISTYAWDGRDEFGDQLANGVYFYKVYINANGAEMAQRSTSADRAFKNGFGKLYILR